MDYKGDRILTDENTPEITPGSYAPGDVVGGLIKFDLSSPLNGGMLTDVRVVDADAVGAPLDLYIFDIKPTLFSDNTAFEPTRYDLNHLIKKLQITADAYEVVNGIGRVHLENVNKGFNVQAPAPTPRTPIESGQLYLYIVTPFGDTYLHTDGITVSVTAVS